MLRGTDRNTNHGCWLSSVPLKKLDLDLLPHSFRDSLACPCFFLHRCRIQLLWAFSFETIMYSWFLGNFRFLCFNFIQEWNSKFFILNNLKSLSRFTNKYWIRPTICNYLNQFDKIILNCCSTRCIWDCLASLEQHQLCVKFCSNLTEKFVVTISNWAYGRLIEHGHRGDERSLYIRWKTIAVENKMVTCQRISRFKVKWVS